MPLKYSTDCEELAYVKDADALRKAADCAVERDGLESERFFGLGEKYAGHDAVWFNWHGDDYRTGLLFVGTEAEVLSRLRQLPERSDM
jgi:hypothetical protein